MNEIKYPDIDTISIPSVEDILKGSNSFGKIQNFKDLSIAWKTMVVIGAVSIFVVVGLTVLLILIFETELIPIEALLGTKEDLDLTEFDNFFKSMDEELDAELDVDEDSDSESSSNTESFSTREDLIRKIDEISITLDKMSETKNSKNLDENIIDWSLMKIDLQKP